LLTRGLENDLKTLISSSGISSVNAIGLSVTFAVFPVSRPRVKSLNHCVMLLRLIPIAAVILAALPAAAQYIPPKGSGCANGFNYSAGVCVPRGGGGNAYQPPQGSGCAISFNYSAGMCVPRR